MTSRARPTSLAASIIFGAARAALGILWLHEGLFKYTAHFGRADILLVVDSAKSNSRGHFVTGYSQPAPSAAPPAAAPARRSAIECGQRKVVPEDASPTEWISRHVGQHLCHPRRRPGDGGAGTSQTPGERIPPPYQAATIANQSTLGFAGHGDQDVNHDQFMT